MTEEEEKGMGGLRSDYIYLNSREREEKVGGREATESRKQQERRRIEETNTSPKQASCIA